MLVSWLTGEGRVEPPERSPGKPWRKSFKRRLTERARLYRALQLAVARRNRAERKIEKLKKNRP